jgi:hypothetical protein
VPTLLVDPPLFGTFSVKCVAISLALLKEMLADNVCVNWQRIASLRSPAKPATPADIGGGGGGGGGAVAARSLVPAAVPKPPALDARAVMSPSFRFEVSAKPIKAAAMPTGAGAAKVPEGAVEEEEEEVEEHGVAIERDVARPPASAAMPPVLQFFASISLLL